MTDRLRSEIESIFGSAVDSVRADHAVRSNLTVLDRRRIIVCGNIVDVAGDAVYAIAFGKAAVGMIDSAAQVLGEMLTLGIAVTKSEQPIQHDRITILRGSHPVPDDRSLAAGDALLKFVEDIPAGAVVLVLISGGGSSLVESLRDGVDLSRLRELTSGLLRAGASIQELNAVRSRLSRIKAGGLLHALSRARVYNLIVSDVLGDNLQAIASGPTVPPVDSNAERVMQTYQLAGTLPPYETSEEVEMPPTRIIANLQMAMDAATEAAVGLGYRPIVEPQFMTGEARDVGRRMAERMRDVAGESSQVMLLAGGETTVTVVGDGVGGRNTEAALSAAISLAGIGNIAIGFLATDGDDGMTGAAGAIVDGETCRGLDDQDALRALADNDSYTLLAGRRAIVSCGPTGTNVNDLVIGLVG